MSLNAKRDVGQFIEYLKCKTSTVVAVSNDIISNVQQLQIFLNIRGVEG